MKALIAIVTATALAMVTPAWAQSQPAVNNGTNPTILANAAGFQYKYTDFGSGFSNGLIEAYALMAFGPGNPMSLEFRLPYTSGPINTHYGLGDASLKFVHVLEANPSYGIAYTAKLSLDTADRPDLGSGQTVLELSGFYAKFFKDGSLISPALVQTIGLGDEDPGRTKVNITTFDLYYVPKLSTDKMFITFDPNVSYDWEQDKIFGSLTPTFGFPMGRAFGGDSQIYIAPKIFVGADRPSDWSIQVGYKVLGF